MRRLGRSVPPALPAIARATAPPMAVLGIAVLGVAALFGCDEPARPSPAPGTPPPKLVTHDYGTVQHGHTSTHDFVLEVPGGGAGMVPEGFQTACSCATWEFMLRNDRGELREIGGLPRAARSLQEGDTVVLRMTVDTNKKEAVDHKPVNIKGSVRMRDLEAVGPFVFLPLAFSFAIDAPIEIRPVAHVHFGALAASQTYRESLELHPDAGAGAVQFGEVDTTDPRLTAELRREQHADGSTTVVDLVFDPGEKPILGPARAALRISTSLGSYILQIPVSGEITSDIVVKPFAHVSFGSVDLGAPRPTDECSVILTDHRKDRPPGFEVYSIVDKNGVSVVEHFEARLEPVPNMPRSTRAFLRYVGGMTGTGFRGVLRLRKPAGPITDITFVGFDKKR